MNIYLWGNIIIAAVLAAGVYWMRDARAEEGHIASLFILYFGGAWIVWVLIGAALMLAIGGG